MSTLFVVATPLGNLEDLSPRAKRVLESAGVLFAEDTRRTRALLQHLGISRAVESLHEHNERARIERVQSLLDHDQTVALVSDAGTPVVSDPGAEVVAAAKAAGHRVSPIPGPSAWAAALCVSGFPAIGCLFVGFVPHKGKPRTEALERVGAHPDTVVVFESPHRVAKTLDALAEAQPDRRACVTRELTKLHEEVRDGTLAELAVWAREPIKGEITVVLGPWRASAVAASHSEVHAALSRCARAGTSARDAATAVAAVLDRPRREVYRYAQESGLWD